METTKQHNWPGFVSKLAAWLVGLLAIMAFVLSYSSLQHMAAGHGITGWLSYVWPALLDFAMVVFSLAILRANLRQEPSWYPWSLTIAFSGVSVLANILDVTPLGIPSVVIAAGVKALAPVALVLAFELLMTMVRAEIRAGLAKVDNVTQVDTNNVATTSRKPDTQDTAASHEPNRTPAPVPLDIVEPEPVPVVVPLPAGDDDLTERQRQIWQMTAAGMSIADIADRLKVSTKTVSRDKAALNGRLG